MCLYRSVCGTDAACSSNTIRDSISHIAPSTGPTLRIRLTYYFTYLPYSAGSLRTVLTGWRVDLTVGLRTGCWRQMDHQRMAASLMRGSEAGFGITTAYLWHNWHAYTSVRRCHGTLILRHTLHGNRQPVKRCEQPDRLGATRVRGRGRTLGDSLTAYAYCRAGPLHRETAWLGVGLRAD